MDIIAADADDQVRFEYQDVGQASSYDMSYTITVMDQCLMMGGGEVLCPNNNYSPQTANNTSTVAQKGVKTIYFEGGKIVFNLAGSNRSDANATNLKALDNIEVKDKNDVTLKTIKFNFGYFTTSNSTNHALKLNSVHLDGGTWKQITKTYTGTSMVLNEGTAIDDVRIYPVDARMKSYTYHSINGMTSSIDERGQTFTYEYDSFGRLKRVINDKGGIEKEYSYHYKGPN